LLDCGRGFGLLPSFGSFALFRKCTFTSVSPVLSFYFYNHIISTGTSGNRSIAHLYVYECIFSSFLELCWHYKHVDNDHQLGVFRRVTNLTLKPLTLCVT
jgi:hypothetical protein